MGLLCCYPTPRVLTGLRAGGEEQFVGMLTSSEDYHEALFSTRKQAGEDGLYCKCNLNIFSVSLESSLSKK